MKYEYGIKDGCYCIGPQNGLPYCPCKMQERLREKEFSSVNKLDYIKGTGIVKELDNLLNEIQEELLNEAMNNWGKPNKSRMVKLPEIKVCRDPGHNVPTMLYVPSGHMYIHVCPSCGQEARIISPVITC